MLKTAFLFLLGLMIFQSAKAQKQIFYFDKSNQMVDTKDSAFGSRDHHGSSFPSRAD